MAKGNSIGQQTSKKRKKKCMNEKRTRKIITKKKKNSFVRTCRNEYGQSEWRQIK